MMMMYDWESIKKQRQRRSGCHSHWSFKKKSSDIRGHTICNCISRILSMHRTEYCRLNKWPIERKRFELLDALSLRGLFSPVVNHSCVIIVKYGQRQRQNVGDIDSSMKKPEKKPLKYIYIYIWLNDCCCCLFCWHYWCWIIWPSQKSTHVFVCIAHIEREKRKKNIIKHWILHSDEVDNKHVSETRATTKLNKWIKIPLFQFSKQKKNEAKIGWMITEPSPVQYTPKPHNTDVVYFSLTLALYFLRRFVFFFAFCPRNW